MDTKICCRCNVRKLLSEFCRNKNTKDKRDSRCRICKATYCKQWRERDLEKIKKRDREYYWRHVERYREYSRQYNKRHTDEKRKYSRNYYPEYNRIRRARDPLYKLSGYLSSRIWYSFKRIGLNKQTNTETLLGIDWLTCKQYIEGQFSKDMNWNNYGEWHIDHKIPLISAKTEKGLITLCHYTNLQPLWAFDNHSKNGRIIPTQMTLTL